MKTKNTQLLFHYHDDSFLYQVKQKGYLRWLDTNSKMIQSAIDCRNPQEFILSYQVPTTAILALLKRPPKRLLLLGLGGGSIAKFLERTLPESKLTIVDNALSMMRNLAEDYFEYTPQSNTEFVSADAYDYLKNHQGSFDLIISDIYGQDDLPEIMKSPNYYRALAYALSPHGAVSLNLVCETQSEFLLLLNWLRHAFNCETLSHGLANTHNAILYGFKQKDWQIQLEKLVQAGIFKKPLFSQMVGSYLETFPMDFEKRFRRYNHWYAAAGISHQANF